MSQYCYGSIYRLSSEGTLYFYSFVNYLKIFLIFMTIAVRLQERSVQNGKYALSIYICYLIYAPLYLAGPIISFNAFASQVCEFSVDYIFTFCFHNSVLVYMEVVFVISVMVEVDPEHAEYYKL